MSSNNEAAKDLIRSAVHKGATAAANSASTDASPDDVGLITTKILKEVAPIIVNATNQEPFYQSRVTIGAVITLIGSSYTLFLDFWDGTPPTVDSLSAQVGAIAGAAIVIYGRWFAKKPLGE